MKAIKIGCVQWVGFVVLYILTTSLKNKPIEKYVLLYSTIFIIVPIIAEALRLYIKNH